MPSKPKAICSWLAVATAALLTLADPAGAEPIAFSGWTHQKFSLLGGNAWQQAGSELSVASDSAVSLLWRAVPATAWQATSASWRWSVEAGVPPTDLSQKGGDDRNLSLYVIFAPQEVAVAAGRMGIRRLLEHPDVRVLMYVWGGAHRRGAVVPSPYLGARGMSIVLRPAGVGTFEEKVDLRSDLAKVFGRADLAVIGLAVSADSDDTKSRIRARLGTLRLSN
jgi:hypothetical protein